MARHPLTEPRERERKRCAERDENGERLPKLSLEEFDPGENKRKYLHRRKLKLAVEEMR